MSASARKPYDSTARRAATEANRGRILAVALELFSRHGIDTVTIEAIAAAAGCSQSTVYAAFKSKTGILREIVQAAIFSPNYQVVAAGLSNLSDPVDKLAYTARVCRTIYENEGKNVGLLRGASMFSPELRAVEQEFEAARFDMQAGRIHALSESGRLKPGLDVDAARHLLWMYTSRDVYRMLVVDRGWSADRFEAWLALTLMHELTDTRGEN